MGVNSSQGSFAQFGKKMTEEHLIITWKEIREKLLRIEDTDRYLCTLQTLARTYGPELKRVGAVFQWHIGRGKKPVIACWPSIFKKFFMIMQQERYAAKEKAKLNKKQFDNK